MQLRLFLAVSSLLAFASRGEAQPYAVVELQVLAGQTAASATNLNNRLQIVGRSGDGVVVWDSPHAAPRSLGTRTASGAAVLINDHGVIGGVAPTPNGSKPFILAGNVLYEPAVPDTVYARMLTNSGFLLLLGSRSWAAFQTTIYDLTGLTGAYISAANDAGLIGGSLQGQPYLRYPDGLVTQPWVGGFASVSVIGPSGHFAGSTPSNFPSIPSASYYGAPDGHVTRLSVGISPLDINARGDLVGSWVFRDFPRGYDAIPYRYRNARFIPLNAAVLDYSRRIKHAIAINDGGYILATATTESLFPTIYPVLLIPVAPRAPSGLATSSSGGFISLMWDEPVGATDYVLEAGSVSGASDLFVGSVGSTTRLTAAPPPGRYYVRLRARNDIGLSPPSPEILVDVR